MGVGIAQRYSYESFERDRVIDEFSFTLPEPPPKNKIDGYGLADKKQKFTPPDKQTVKVISYKLINKDPLTKEEADFIDLQWDRRENGYWFFNNGYLEYITGLHYYYLTAWNITRVEEFTTRDGKTGKRKISGLPSFTDSDRDYFYIWDDCVRDEGCFGLIHITNRRDGKTYRSTATVNELISRSPDSIGGIQSKTDTDGSKVFKKLVSSWKKLPEYFKPVDVGDSDPAKKLEYKNPKKRSTKTQRKEYSEVLESEINFGNAREEYYDGDGLAIIFHDEIGKTDPKNANVWVRWDIVRECLADGADVTGKGLLTTTVEDMEKKGGINCKKIWDESDTSSETYGKTKQTISGLKRYFKPATYGLRGADKGDEDDDTPEFIDKYGYSDIISAEAYLIKIEKTLSGEKLISRRRKYPRNIQHAFISSGKEEVFSSAKIYEQKEFNETLKESTVRRGNFVWDDMANHKVSFHEDEKGFFQVSWMPEENMRCYFEMDGRGFPKPMNVLDGLIGVDPFDHKKTVSKKKSDASATYFKMFNINNPTTSNGFIFHYLGRRDDPFDFYEDMVKAAVFYGVQMLVENQKPGLLNHLRTRGYHHYMRRTQQGDYTQTTSRTHVEGISMAGNLVRQQGINNLATYIYRFIGKISEETQMKEFGWSKEEVREDLYGNCPFESLLDDWLKFESENWTDYDATVSSIVTLLGVNPTRKRERNIDENAPTISLSSLISTYNI